MADILSNPAFIQSIGFLALILGSWAFFQHSDYKLKALLIAQSSVLAIHFFLLGANGGFIAAIITTLRNTSSLFDRLKNIAPLFICMYIILGFYSYEIWVDVLPIVASVLGTIGFFYFDKIKMRLFALTGTSLWIVHNLTVMSIGPFFMEVFLLFINLRTIYKIYKAEALQA